MNIENWKTLAKELVSYGGVFQVIISGGEPLLFGEKLFDLMDIFHEDNTKFIVITNAYLLKPYLVERFSKYRFSWFQISIDGTSADVHDTFRQKNGSWIRAIQGALSVSKKGIPLKIASCIIPSEISRLEEYVKQAYRLGASAVILGDVMPSGRAYQNSDIIMTNQEKAIFLEKVYDLREKYRALIDVQVIGFVSTQLKQATAGTIDSIIVRPNGDLRLDCVAPFTAGNYLETSSFKELWDNISGNIWSSKKVKEYIDSVNPISGESSLIKNYLDRDVRLEK